MPTANRLGAEEMINRDPGIIMSKLHRSFFALACAATLFSCTKDDILETPKVSLTFSVANELSASKAV